MCPVGAQRLVSARNFGLVQSDLKSVSRGAVVNSSRGIIFAHERAEYEHLASTDWQRAVEAATRDMIGQLAAETPARRLG